MNAKQWIGALALVSLLPGMAWAQTHDVTRAEVKAQLVQAERNGTLHPSNTHYPDGMASANAPAQNDSGYGASPQGHSQAGVRVRWQSGSASQAGDTAQLYEHH
ncbi:DUF4148 domain-containing protein [Paraburkholderia acidisoli]|uniref:DUF4148 domain-containing protein n=1 Tax=Paraburkholderia acidisoli TaxID=2571748 RepID=A0A7Z2GPV4_9BURK|nr:DUF4148 domain-containing protein [Paraburkholderia acidisoli]QGZ65673.1 DUF4148 domain-containing protein [Paraburkholderia acidisoli]